MEGYDRASNRMVCTSILCSRLLSSDDTYRKQIFPHLRRITTRPAVPDYKSSHCSFLFVVFYVFVFFFCSHWSLVDVPLIFFCPADHVPDWQPRILLGMVEARSVNVKKTTTQQHLPLNSAKHLVQHDPRVPIRHAACIRCGGILSRCIRSPEFDRIIARATYCIRVQQYLSMGA